MDLILVFILIGVMGAVFIKIYHRIWEERHKRMKAAEEEVKNRIREVIRPHVDVLSRKKKQLTYMDDYGIYRFNEERWEKEVDYFIDNVILPKVGRLNHVTLSDETFLGRLTSFEFDLNIDVRTLIDAEIWWYETRNNRRSGEVFDVNMTGYDYEHFCSELLRNSGWNCRTTPASGDQGADIIADMKGHTIVVQCKKSSSSSIGNKAVQEVYSARTYYGADSAIVVTNSSYSQSAKNLAHSLGVILMHHEELPTLAKKLGCC